MATRRVERSRARVQALVAELPHPRVDVRRFAPSGPLLLAGCAIVAFAIGSYGVARETPLFEIRRIEIVGAPSGVGDRVREALGPLEGRSLVGLSAEDVDRRIAPLPDVAGVTYDRAFPHALRVYVLAERPVAVLRRGAESWLVSVRARVVRRIPKGAQPELPRIWVPRSVDVAAGDTLADAAAARAVRVLALARTELPARVRSVRTEREETALILRAGVEVRLGREHDLRLKLAVAAQLLPHLGDDGGYLDVAVPDRPVSGHGETQSQLEP